MKGMWNLSVSLATPVVILPKSTCSLLRRAHPNGRTAKPVSPAHDVDIQPVREQMLSHAAPEWRDRKTCQSRTRCWQLVCQQAHARTGRAHRAKLAAELAEGKYSLVIPPAHTYLLYITIVMGVWGFAP